MRLIDATELDGYKFGLISPQAQKLFHDTINNAPTIDAIPIPEEATNGDMMKAMFKVEIKHIFDDLNVVVIVLDGKTKVFDLDWWNALYKGE